MTSKMGGRKSGRVRKQVCQVDQNAEPPAKRKKNELNAASTEPPTQMKITGLNDDCLEHIFKLLTIDDLLKVADARKSLKDGIDQAFRSKYGKRKVKFNIGMYGSSEAACESDEEIEIFDFVTALKFLRSFGGLNSTLKIVYDRLQRDRRLELDRYLSGYCTETLNELTLLGTPKGAIAGLKQSFKNVEKLCVQYGLGRKLSDFNRWFPNLKYLKLDSIRLLTDRRCIEVHLPHLTHLEINDAIFNAKNVSNCLRLNQQLQKMRISNRDNLPIILKSTSQLLQLEDLHVEYCGNAIFAGMEETHFKTVKNFSMDFGNHSLSMIPLSFDRLEQLTIEVEDLTSTDIFKHFIKESTSIKKISVNFRKPKIPDNVKEQVKEEMTKKLSPELGWSTSLRFENHYSCIEFERNY